MAPPERPYSWPLLHALFDQAFLILFTACGSPQNEFFLACVYSSVGYWVGVVFILVRRGRSPTEGDLRYISWGLLPIGLIGMFVALLYWSFAASP